MGKKIKKDSKNQATEKKVIQHFLVFVSPAKKDKVDLELREKTERIQKGRKRHQKVKHESLVTLTAQNLTETLDASCVRFAVSANLFFFTPCQREKGLSGKDFACNVGDVGSILGLGDPLEKERAVHSSMLAWEIPWTEEPGRLQPMGSQKSCT